MFSPIQFRFSLWLPSGYLQSRFFRDTYIWRFYSWKKIGWKPDSPNWFKSLTVIKSALKLRSIQSSWSLSRNYSRKLHKSAPTDGKNCSSQHVLLDIKIVGHSTWLSVLKAFRVEPGWLASTIWALVPSKCCLLGTWLACVLLLKWSWLKGSFIACCYLLWKFHWIPWYFSFLWFFLPRAGANSELHHYKEKHKKIRSFQKKWVYPNNRLKTSDQKLETFTFGIREQNKGTTKPQGQQLKMDLVTRKK